MAANRRVLYEARVVHHLDGIGARNGQNRPVQTRVGRQSIDRGTDLSALDQRAGTIVNAYEVPGAQFGQGQQTVAHRQRPFGPAGHHLCHVLDVFVLDLAVAVVNVLVVDHHGQSVHHRARAECLQSALQHRDAQQRHVLFGKARLEPGAIPGGSHHESESQSRPAHLLAARW